MGLLVFGKACQVNHIKQVFLVCLIDCIYIFSQILRIDILLLLGYIVERGAYYLANLIFIVVNNAPLELINQKRQSG